MFLKKNFYDMFKNGFMFFKQLSTYFEKMLKIFLSNIRYKNYQKNF